MEKFEIRDIEFNRDFKTLDYLQRQFNNSMGYQLSSKDLLYRSYNPVIDRWHIEKTRPDQKEAYRKELIENVYTNLKERYHVSTSAGTYSIKNGHLYSEFFPEQPFSHVILRGAEYRVLHGSREQQREGILGELGGFIQIQGILTNPETPIGTRVISFSPPGELIETAYTGKFVDVFTLVEKDSKKIIHRNRLSVDYSREMYLTKALQLESSFLEGYDGRPMDAWFLSHPIVIPDEYSLFEGKDRISEAEFFRRMQSKTRGTPLEHFIQYYIDKIYEDPIDWKKVAMAFNSIVNKADELIDDSKPDHGVLYSEPYSLYEQIQRLGVQEVKIIGGGGCPSNKGFSIFGSEYKLLDMKDYFKNSVTQFSEDETWDYHSGKCVVCEKDPTDVGPCNICKECEKKL